MLRIEKNNQLVDNHFNQVFQNIINRIQNIINKGGLEKKDTATGNMVLSIVLSADDRAFLNRLQNRNFLKKIITASPIQLRGFIRLIKRYYPHAENKTSVLYNCLYNIFVSHGYNKRINLNKYEFIKNIGLESCPYCNRSYIYTLGRNRMIKPEIDHFYPKDIYPLLAISYFNLIPSCPTCNGLGAKSNKDTYADYPLKNPYEIEPHDFIFDFDLNSMNILNPITNIDKESINIFFDTHITAHNDVFGLDLLYAENRDIVLELYMKIKHEYVSGHIRHLRNYEGIEFSDEEIYRFITCGYLNNKDLHKRPMSKLIKDISIKLNLVMIEDN